MSKQRHDVLIHYSTSRRKKPHIRVRCEYCKRMYSSRGWVNHMREVHGIEAKVQKITSRRHYTE